MFVAHGDTNFRSLYVKDLLNDCYTEPFQWMKPNWEESLSRKEIILQNLHDRIQFQDIQCLFAFEGILISWVLTLRLKDFPQGYSSFYQSLRYSWFLFEWMTKSIALMLTLTRKDHLDSFTFSLLKEIIQRIAREISQNEVKLRSVLTFANRSIALFLRDMMGLLYHEQISELIIVFIEALLSNEKHYQISSRSLFEVLNIVYEYDNLISICELYQTIPADKDSLIHHYLKSRCGDSRIQEKLASDQPFKVRLLPLILISEVCQGISHIRSNFDDTTEDFTEAGYLAVMATECFRRVLTKIEFDSRAQGILVRSSVFKLFESFIWIVPHIIRKCGDSLKWSLSSISQKDLFACFFSILRCAQADDLFSFIKSLAAPISSRKYESRNLDFFLEFIFNSMKLFREDSSESTEYTSYLLCDLSAPKAQQYTSYLQKYSYCRPFISLAKNSFHSEIDLETTTKLKIWEAVFSDQVISLILAIISHGVMPWISEELACVNPSRTRIMRICKILSKILLSVFETHQSAFNRKRALRLVSRYIGTYPWILELPFKDQMNEKYDICQRWWHQIIKHGSTGDRELRARAGDCLIFALILTFRNVGSIALAKKFIFRSWMKLLDLGSDAASLGLKKSAPMLSSASAIHELMSNFLRYLSRRLETSSVSQSNAGIGLAAAVQISSTLQMLKRLTFLHKSTLISQIEDSPDLKMDVDTYIDRFKDIILIAEECGLIEDQIRYLEILRDFQTQKGFLLEAALCQCKIGEIMSSKVSLRANNIDNDSSIDNDLLNSALERAVVTLEQADAVELSIPLLEGMIRSADNEKRFVDAILIEQRLSAIHESVFDYVSGKRFRSFGSFYKVGIYGTMLEELHGKEYIYKEKGLARLADVKSRLHSAFQAWEGVEKVTIVLDSNEIDTSDIEPGECKIQITAVDPYWEDHHVRTDFSKNYRLNKFTFSIPFTLSGKSQGSIGEQYKRMVILIVEHPFPFFCQRVRIINKKEHILSPIENITADIRSRIEKLETEIRPTSGELDLRTLSQFLSGSVCVQVNAGIGEVCTVFLSNTEQFPAHDVLTLKSVLKEFFELIKESLPIARSLAKSAEQLKFQEEFENGYSELWDFCAEYLQ